MPISFPLLSTLRDVICLPRKKCTANEKRRQKDKHKNLITKKCEKDAKNPISIHQKKTKEGRKFHFVDVEAKRNP